MNGFINLRKDIMCTLHDFACILLSMIVQDVESTVQESTEHSFEIT